MRDRASWCWRTVGWWRCRRLLWLPRRQLWAARQDDVACSRVSCSLRTIHPSRTWKTDDRRPSYTGCAKNNTTSTIQRLKFGSLPYQWRIQDLWRGGQWRVRSASWGGALSGVEKQMGIGGLSWVFCPFSYKRGNNVKDLNDIGLLPRVRGKGRQLLGMTRPSLQYMPTFGQWGHLIRSKNSCYLRP